MQLLGGVRVERPDGTVARLRNKELLLLAHVLLDRGVAHPRRVLVDRLWPDLDERAGRNNLRVALSRLRRGLAVEGAEAVPWVEVTTSHVHVAADAPVVTDVDELVDGRVPEGSLELLAGVAVPGPSADDWLAGWRTRVHRRALAALEATARRALTDGDVATAEDLAARMLDLDAAAEAALELQVRAAAADGRHDEAARRLGEAGDHLAREVGARPGRWLAELAAELGLEGPAAAPDDEAAPLAVRPLPRPTTSFHGREAELDAIRDLLGRRHRLVTLTGLGGIGKSRLALEAARALGDRYQEGAALVLLAGLEQGGDVPAAVAAALGLSGVADADDPTATLVDRLADRDVLVVLDNAEDWLDEVADVARALLDGCGWLHLLVTSRVPLDLRDEALVRLRGLPNPATSDAALADQAATRVLLDRARQAAPTLEIDPDDEHVATICRAVAGMPLGLELAAAALRERDLAAVAAEVASAPEDLAADLRDLPERHHALLGVLTAAVTRVEPADREGLEALAVFRAGASREAAAAVTGIDEPGLRRLLRASLVHRTDDGRLVLHELVRQFAERRLDRDPARAADARARHAAHHLRLLAAAAPRLRTDGAREAAEELEQQRDDLRQAWQHAVRNGDVAALLPAAPGLVELAESSGRLREAAELLAGAVTAAEQVGDRPSSVVLRGLQVRALLHEGPIPDVRRLLQEAIDRADDDDHLLAPLLVSVGDLHNFRDPDAAWFGDAMARLEAIRARSPDAVRDAFVDVVVGLERCRTGAFDEAQELLEDALGVLRTAGHLRGEMIVHARLAPVHAERYALWAALEADRAAHALAVRLGNASRRLVQTYNLAASLVLVGRHDEAEDMTREARRSAVLQGDDAMVAFADAQLAEIADALGDHARAERLHARSIDEMLRLGEDYVRFRLFHWVRFLVDRGRWLEAELAAVDMAERNETAGSGHWAAAARALLAVALVHQQRHDEARTQVELVWPQLQPPELTGDGLPYPVQTMVDVHRVLAALDDDRAPAVLAAAREIVRRTAADIADPATRRTYLENVAVCRHVLAPTRSGA